MYFPKKGKTEKGSKHWAIESISCLPDIFTLFVFSFIADILLAQ